MWFKLERIGFAVTFRAWIGLDAAVVMVALFAAEKEKVNVADG